ncbi:uncharacterized protein B0J16DRAFT_336571 [Fusarium flagelliforme]|uniref:uncharacterized protein n=1 Tax=Fusarium flagelliforme TaxID=2675880 RepID=UPI001E8D2625|nr:uncharacterized protein B0J16DRAFT_336571 [Fusarium flagelliforme]KAH7188184.1 hypothetical protein B0J16DRAFT_336571 [Fusarium flagelliforme]
MSPPHMIPRQEAQVITQTVVLPSTTYTTHVTLSTDRPAVPVTSQHSGDGLTSAEIGAIVGSVVGAFILAFIVVCCCCRRRPRVKTVKRRRSERSYSGSEDDWSVVMPHENWTRPVPVPVRGPTPVQYPRPAAVREQVPGGPKFPTYRAIPIPNPRRSSNPPRTYQR